MMEYCDVCGKEVETQVITRQETYNVCGEEIMVNAQVMVCAECGEELFNEELDSATLIKAYNEYRRRHKLLLQSCLIGETKPFAGMRMERYRIRHTTACCCF